MTTYVLSCFCCSDIVAKGGMDGAVRIKLICVG